MTGEKHKPIIGISMGDPTGIGPEIIVRALSRPRVHELCQPIVIGDAGVIEQAQTFVDSQRQKSQMAETVTPSPGAQGEGRGEGAFSISRKTKEPSPLPSPLSTRERESSPASAASGRLVVRSVARMADARFEPSTINVFDLKNVDLSQLQLGKVSAMAGNAAFEAVKTTIELALRREIDATVTAPIHKEALVAAGHHFPGHTEIFAHFTGTSDFTMMLAAGEVRVVHVSTHVSLRQACDAVTRQRVLTVIELAHRACRQLGIANPKIGVAGLNPHASDGGLFGAEEREHIIPAIEAAKAKGMLVEGPQAPDTFFAKAMSGIYDVCVAMYHDQGHIPVKMHGFHFDRQTMSWDRVMGINVSLGMPIIRTSVDHGTAFDQAGKGTASDESLLDAIEYAAKLAENR